MGTVANRRAQAHIWQGKDTILLIMNMQEFIARSSSFSRKARNKNVLKISMYEMQKINSKFKNPTLAEKSKSVGPILSIKQNRFNCSSIQ